MVRASLNAKYPVTLLWRPLQSYSVAAGCCDYLQCSLRNRGKPFILHRKFSHNGFFLSSRSTETVPK